MASSKACIACGQKIGTEKFIEDEQKRPFHQVCFTCEFCKLPLVLETYSEIQGKRICQSCRNQEVCQSCGLIITGSKSMELDGKLWHLDCFVCSSCFSPLKKFFEEEGELFCGECYNKRQEDSGDKCAGCSKALGTGSFFKALDKMWHEECFVCTSCRLLLEDDFVNKQGKPYCDNCATSTASTSSAKTAASAAAGGAKGGAGAASSGGKVGGGGAVGASSSAAGARGGAAAGGGGASRGGASGGAGTKGQVTRVAGGGGGAAAGGGAVKPLPAQRGNVGKEIDPNKKFVTTGYQKKNTNSENWNDLETL